MSAGRSGSRPGHHALQGSRAHRVGPSGLGEARPIRRPGPRACELHPAPRSPGQGLPWVRYGGHRVGWGRVMPGRGDLARRTRPPLPGRREHRPRTAGLRARPLPPGLHQRLGRTLPSADRLGQRLVVAVARRVLQLRRPADPPPPRSGRDDPAGPAAAPASTGPAAAARADGAAPAADGPRPGRSGRPGPPTGGPAAGPPRAAPAAGPVPGGSGRPAPEARPPGTGRPARPAGRGPGGSGGSPTGSAGPAARGPRSPAKSAGSPRLGRQAGPGAGGGAAGARAGLGASSGTGVSWRASRVIWSALGPRTWVRATARGWAGTGGATGADGSGRCRSGG